MPWGKNSTTIEIVRKPCELVGFFKLSHSTLSIIIDKKTNDYLKYAKYIC